MGRSIEPKMGEDAPVQDAARVAIVHFRRGLPKRAVEERLLIEERPLTIDVVGTGQFTIMRTPGFEEELITGFLFSEGLIDRVEQVLLVDECPSSPDQYRVRITSEKQNKSRRNLTVSSSCGLCGRTDLGELVKHLGVVSEGIEVEKDVLYRLPKLVAPQQTLFAKTGGSHAAALFASDGKIILVREDLGRHNALDKVVGSALLTDLPLADKGIFLSGRASLEMVLKAARSRIALVAAVSAPSSRAVEAAKQFGITLCGFVRGEEFAVYCHDWRIHDGEASAR